MAVSVVSVGQKITAALMNTIIGLVNKHEIGWHPFSPTSLTATGGSQTLSSTGVFTFTGATDLVFLGLFDQGYRRVEVHLEIDSSTVSDYVDARMCNAAGTASATAISLQVLLSSGATPSSGSVGGQVNAAAAPRHRIDLEFTNANLATRTDIIGRGSDIPSAGAPTGFISDGVHQLNTAFPALRITPRSGAITGKGTIRGYIETF